VENKSYFDYVCTDFQCMDKKKNIFLCTTEEEKKSEKVQNNMRVYKKLKQNYFKVNSRFKLSVGLSVSSHDMNSLVCAAAEFQQV